MLNTCFKRKTEKSGKAAKFKINYLNNYILKQSLGLNSLNYNNRNGGKK